MSDKSQEQNSAQDPNKPADQPKDAQATQLEAPAPTAGSHSLVALATSPALAIWFDQAVFDRARQIATYIARAEGFTPPHLVGKPEACFMVVELALTWRLSPSAVARSTYPIPGGKVGYEGKLCQAILENSGKLVGPVKYQHYGAVTIRLPSHAEITLKSNDPALAEFIRDKGAVEIRRKDWSAVMGKFKLTRGNSGKEYPAPTWTREDAIGLGVTVIAQVKGEVDVRRWDFDLEQAYPLNSTLWATDPRSQICYTAVRRFGNLAAPGLYMGVPFDGDDFAEGVTQMREINPAAPPPNRRDYQDDPLSAAKPAVKDVDPASGAAAGQAASDQQQGGAGDGQPEQGGEADQGGGTNDHGDGLQSPGIDLLDAWGNVSERGLDVPVFIIAVANLFGRARASAELEAIWQHNAEAINALSEDSKASLVEAYSVAMNKFPPAGASQPRTRQVDQGDMLGGGGNKGRKK